MRIKIVHTKCSGHLGFNLKVIDLILLFNIHNYGPQVLVKKTFYSDSITQRARGQQKPLGNNGGTVNTHIKMSWKCGQQLMTEPQCWTADWPSVSGAETAPSWSILPACPSLSQLEWSLIAPGAGLTWLVYGTVLRDIVLYIMFQSNRPWGSVAGNWSMLWCLCSAGPLACIQKPGNTAPALSLWRPSDLPHSGPWIIIPYHPNRAGCFPLYWQHWNNELEDI